jgi:hypothetical protein
MSETDVSEGGRPDAKPLPETENAPGKPGASGV